MRSILTIARFTLIESIRNRLFILVLLGVFLLFLLALFIGGLAITETVQVQNAMAAIVLRLFAVFITSVFVITSTIREFNDKGVELIIALDLDRYIYMLGKMLGFYLLSVLIAAVVCAPLILTADLLPLAVWCSSLIFELWIVTAFSLLSLITFKNITSVFAVVAAFYLLARTINVIQMIGSSAILELSLSHKVIAAVIDIIALLLPTLDQFTRTEWLVYGSSINDYLFVVIQAAIYIPLLLAAAAFDLQRRNF